MNAATLTKLQKTARSAQKKLWAAQERQRQKELNACVGKFFKYRNNYSCPETPADYWWLYAAVVEKQGEVVRLEFQTDKDGKTEFGLQRFFLSDSWKEITREEYKAELDKARAAFATFNHLI